MIKLKLFISCLVFSIIGSNVALSQEIKPKYGPKDAPVATTLSASNDYFRDLKNPAPDFWSLIGYYVPQFNQYSCSVAAVSMVINAARTHLPKTADDTLLTQKILLDKVDTEQWKQRVSEEGLNGEHGTSLLRLSRIVLATFKNNGFPNVSVKAVEVKNKSDETKAALHEALVANEKSAENFIIAHFNQKVFTDDADVGHIAPIGAYDSVKKRVLILDPDRDYYEPYWVSEDALLDGIATQDKLKNHRGYLVISL